MTTTHHSTPLLRPTEVAELLGRSVAALAMMRHRGTGPDFIRTGGVIRYRISSIEHWLNANEHQRT
jgi:predicted DNA-binding transcriptional regulator AlpA